MAEGYQRSLAIAILASSFGSGKRPRRSALRRLSLVVCGMLGAGIGLGLAVKDASLMPLPDAGLLYFPTLIATQVVLLGGLMAAHGVVNPGTRDTISRWLLVLPLQPLYRFYIRVLPVLTLTFLLLLLAGAPIMLAVHAMGLSLLESSVALACGTAVAVAWQQLSRSWPSPIRLGATGFLVWTEYKLASIIANPLSTSSDQIVAQTALSCLLALIIVRFVRAQTNPSPAHPGTISTNPLMLPSALWMTAKVIRSPVMQSSLVTALAISGGITYACYAFGITDAAALSATATILAGAVAADSRMLCRQKRPPEIAGLRGCLTYMQQLHGTIVPLAALSVSPLLWLLAKTGNLDLTVMVALVSGILCGLCASTIVSPAPRNIVGQVTAILVCIALVFCSEQLIPDSVTPLASYAAIAVLIATISTLVEYKRNRYLWRSL